ncbi:MAG: response regulator transcription factor [Anaerolineales bacterium]
MRPPSSRRRSGTTPVSSPPLHKAGLLTDRQFQVLAAMAEGLDNGQISERLGISPQTVKNHVRAIFATAEVHSRMRAVLWGIRNGLIPPLQ